MTDRTNLVPRDHVGLDRASGFAEANRWPVDQKFVAEARRFGTGEHAWRMGKNSRLTYANDPAVAREFFIVEADDVGVVVAELRAAFDLLDDSEILQTLMAAVSSEELVDALHLVAARAFNTYDLGIAEVVEQGLRNPDLLVELAAALAAYRLGWSRLRPMLDDVAAHHESQVLRDALTNLIELRHWDRG